MESAHTGRENAAEARRRCERNQVKVREGTRPSNWGNRAGVKQWRLLSVSATCWRSAKLQVEYCAKQAELPDVMFLQETHLGHERVEEAMRWLRGCGYKAVMTPAAYSAGKDASRVATRGCVAVCVRAHIGMTPIELPPSQAMQGRWSACHLTGVMAKGIAVMSCYLKVDHTQEELMQELEQILAWCRSLQVPFIIGGDFNASVQRISETGFLRVANAVAIKTDEVTCHAGAGSTIDFFVAHAGLCHRPYHVCVCRHGGEDSCGGLADNDWK
eukprot:1892018-Amphidinium_carterae.2